MSCVFRDRVTGADLKTAAMIKNPSGWPGVECPTQSKYMLFDLLPQLFEIERFHNVVPAPVLEATFEIRLPEQGGHGQDGNIFGLWPRTKSPSSPIP